MEEHEKIELRSDDVQEILGTPPAWLVRWGTLAVFIAIAAMVAAAWFIDYPDIVEGKAVVSTLSPPLAVVSRAEGPIYKLLVEENQSVQPGQVLAVIQSTADHLKIDNLEKEVIHWQALPLDSLVLVDPPKAENLGEVQGEYSIFVQQLEDYKFLTSDKSAGSVDRVSRLNSQIANLRERKRVNSTIIQQAYEALARAREDSTRAKKLYDNDLISLNQLREETGKVLAGRRELEQIKSNNIETDLEIANIQKLIGEISVDDRQGTATGSVRLRESLNKLRNTLTAWKQQYLLTAPISGMATLNAAVFSEQQYVKNGQTVLTIAPPEGQDLIARVEILVAGSGKVKEGQAVKLHLDSYPYEEFGSVEGIVKSKSLVPNGGSYPIQVELPNGLMTNRGEELKFEQQLIGKALIVTENRRFIERFFDKIFARAEQM